MGNNSAWIGFHVLLNREPDAIPLWRLGLIFCSYVSTAKADVTITPEMIRKATGVPLERAVEARERIDAITCQIPGGEA